MKITAIVVDDERASRESLSNYLRTYCPKVEVCGEAGNVDEALKLIGKHSPQLVFLDI